MGNKVFIIQLMNGKTDEEIKTERQKIERELRTYGYDIVNSFISEDAPDGVNVPVYYLGRSIELLSYADYIYLVEGWEAGRGCRIEREVAKEYNIPEVIL